MSGLSESVVIADAGRVPWMTSAASACGRRGWLSSYVTPVSVAPRTARWAGKVRPRRLGDALGRQLRRRPVPGGVSIGRVRHAASASHVVLALGVRAKASERLVGRLSYLHASRFDRRLSALLGPGDRAVIANTSAALETFAAARRQGVTSFLDLPLADPRWIDRMLAEEAERQPEWALTLQHRHRPVPAIARAEAEIELADRILVGSSFARRTLVDMGVDASKVAVTPFGVDTSLFAPPRAALPKDRFRVVFTGQIGQRKGLSYLLEGFELAAIPGSELLLVGRIVGPDSPWRGRAGVRHIPQLPHWELPALLGTCHVFVAPSLVEGFLLSAIEAMACGLPAIVSENTFGRDVITDDVDGFVVPIRDPQAIARHLLELHEDRAKLAAVGQAGARRAREMTWTRHGDAVADALHRHTAVG